MPLPNATTNDADSTRLHFGYEGDGPHCLIGSHGILFARVQQTPHHNAAEYARKFAAVDDLLAVVEQVETLYGEVFAEHSIARGSSAHATDWGKVNRILGEARSALAKATTPKGT